MTQPVVLFGGPSPEHDISILTGLLAARTLGGVPCLYWSKSGEWYALDGDHEGGDFVNGVPARARPVRLVASPGGGFVGDSGPLRRERPFELSAVVNCCHGGPGEDGTLQAALDLAGITYTGPNVAGASLGMDKLAFGAAMAAAGLPVLPRQLARSVPGWRPGFAGPYIVKPRFGGSSIGIEVAADAEAVAALLRNSVHLRAGAVVEPYRADAIDVNVALRVHPAVELSAIVKPERVAGPIYGYREKYVPGEGMAAARQEVDPRLAAGVAEGIREAAVTIAELACVRGVPRIDFLVEGDELFVNEINTIPGSLAKHLWTHVPFTDLLAGMIDEARQRPTTAHWTSAGADGTALRSAGTIASKLG